MPESVKRRGSSGPTMGATVSRSSPGVVAMPGRVRATPSPATLSRSGTSAACGARGRSSPTLLDAMRITVRLFAVLRERAGRAELELDLPDGARVADALAAVEHLAPGVPLVLAVNRLYADPDVPLSAGDELAVVPPV